MRNVRVALCLLLSLFHVPGLFDANAYASTSGVVIAEMFPGASGLASQEFIELYNNSSDAVDVTHWCVVYTSSSGQTTSKLGCLVPPDESTQLFVESYGYITFASTELIQATGSHADVQFNGGISASAGHVRLDDASGGEVDKLGWGGAVNPETSAAQAPANGSSLKRVSIGQTLQDTNNNEADFMQVTPAFENSDVYEVVSIIDICPNIDGVQQTVPLGYMTDAQGVCQLDECKNIEGLQQDIPTGYDNDGHGNCVPHDECDNIDGAQQDIPYGMIRSDGNGCSWDIVALELVEILPNAHGSDNGNEFIEIYNPTDRVINLSLYSVAIGQNQEKTYAFPVGATIGPHEYRAFSDSSMKFTLVNTSGRVVLKAIDGTMLGDTGVYSQPLEGEGWAWLGSTWAYTNQPTPNAPNLPSLQTDDDIDRQESLAPCPVGKYRNPLTNRCRTIVSDAAVLAACDNDQYRNPETGRCKKISVSTLVPCKEGQYRSEETNRCRNIVAASTLVPCRDGQYRSDETNRCRNVTGAAIPDAAYGVEPVKDTGLAFAGWWALGGVGAFALGYAGWEWRRELAAAWATVKSRVLK